MMTRDERILREGIHPETLQRLLQELCTVTVGGGWGRAGGGGATPDRGGARRPLAPAAAPS
jgi:hypothetical protein